jgi:hypothetical protein
VLDHVEGEGQVISAGRWGAVQVVDRCIDAPPLEPPAQIVGARVVEVGERDAIAGLGEAETVAADAEP